MTRASCGLNMLQGIRNNTLDLHLTMSMKISIENGQICNQTTMRERLERFGETWIIYETNSFGLDFVKKM